MAPSTPAPPSSDCVAAFTIASSASNVMSTWRASMHSPQQYHRRAPAGRFPARRRGKCHRAHSFAPALWERLQPRSFRRCRMLAVGEGRIQRATPRASFGSGSGLPDHMDNVRAQAPVRRFRARGSHESIDQRASAVGAASPLVLGADAGPYAPAGRARRRRRPSCSCKSRRAAPHAHCAASKPTSVQSGPSDSITRCATTNRSLKSPDTSSPIRCEPASWRGRDSIPSGMPGGSTPQQIATDVAPTAASKDRD